MTFSGTAPAGAIPGTTSYTVSLWDPYGGPAGHLLGDLPPTTSTTLSSTTVKPGLYYGQPYYWNVNACNGAACSGYNSVWFGLTTMPQPTAAPQLSGAGSTWVVDPDLGGGASWAAQGPIPGWTLSVDAAAKPKSALLTSAPLSLDYTGSWTGGAASWFRLGVQLPAGSSLSVGFGSSIGLTLAGNSSSGWQELSFPVPSSAGTTGSLQFLLSPTGGGVWPGDYPQVGYVERLDGPTARGAPRLGAAADARLPKPVAASSAGGVDAVTGAFSTSSTDLALPGISGLAFSRVYDSLAVGQRIQNGVLTTGSLGPKWSHSWQSSVEVIGTTGLTISTPGGGQYGFVWNGSRYVAPAGVNASLAQDTSSHYTLTTAAQLRYGFTLVAGSSSGTLTSIADRTGNTTTLSYDGQNRLSQIADPGGRYLTLAYDAQSRISSVGDSAGRSVGYAYNAQGDLASVTDVLGHATTYAYSGHLLTQVTDALGQAAVRNSYDVAGSGAVASQLDAAGDTLAYSYATPGAGASRITDQRGNPRTVYFDSGLRVEYVTGAAGTSVAASHDADNNLLGLTNPLGSQLSYSYDSQGNRLSLSDGLGNSWRTSYDGLNNPLVATDPFGHQAGASYDGQGNRSARHDALGDQTSYTRNSLGQLTASTDPRGNVTQFAYNGFGDRTSVTDALGHVTTTVFDTAGRPTSVTDPLNHTSSVSYNAAGWVLSGTDALNHSSSANYDALGHKLTATDALNHTTSWAYEVRGLLSTVTDAAGNRLTTSYPGSTHAVTDAYDQLNRLNTLTDWNGKQTSYSYDAAGRLTTATLPAGTGVVSSYSYDAANRLTGISHVKGGTTLASVSYALDAAGNRTAKTTPAGTESYVLDALNRLTSATPPASSATTYTYDAVGNRATMTTAAGTTNYSYNTADELTAVTSAGAGAVSNSFDANGSQLTRGSDSFTWDAANRLSASTTSGTSSSFSYNGDGLRQSRTIGATTTNFVWDVAAKLPVVLDDGTQYEYGAGLVEHVVGASTYFYLADGLGSIMALVDASGAVVQTYDYDAFGKIRASTGSQGTEFQFAGQQTDPSGLQYLRAHYYDPTTGRLLSRDPSPGCTFDSVSHHPYSYAGNNPVLNSDPSGKVIFSNGLDIEADISPQTVISFIDANGNIKTIVVNVHDLDQSGAPILTIGGCGRGEQLTAIVVVGRGPVEAAFQENRLPLSMYP